MELWICDARILLLTISYALFVLILLLLIIHRHY